MEKVYTLPQPVTAPYSDTQGLALRLIEYRDWSVVRPLLDELEAVGDSESARKLKGFLTSTAYSAPLWCNWSYFCDQVILFLVDYLYSVDRTIEELSLKTWSI